MWFDLSSLPTVPAGGYVNYSYLFLYNQGQGQTCTPQIIDLYRLKVPWGTSLNWYTRPRDDQIEWFGWNSWKYGSSASPCPGAGYQAIDTTLLAKVWLSGSTDYANNGLELRARNESDLETFKLLVAGDVPSNNPNVPVLLVNYITPTLGFSENTVYTGANNVGYVWGAGFSPNTPYDLYFNNVDGYKQFLQTATTDANGDLPLATLNISNVHSPSPTASTGYVHAFIAGAGTDPLWCVSTKSVRVSTEEKPPRILYHYTSVAGRAGILGSGEIDPDLEGNDGPGQYTDMSIALFNRPLYTNKVEAYVAIDVTDLAVEPTHLIYDQESYPRDYLSWLHSSTGPLDVTTRIVGSGNVTYLYE